MGCGRVVRPTLGGIVSTPIQGGRALLRGRVFGFPVHLDLSFVIIMALFGYTSAPPNTFDEPHRTVRFLILWLLITPVAVLVHELGHAIVARTAGAKPEIALAGFGGVTTYVPPEPLSRARSLAISLAGPGIGLALGVVLIFVRRAVEDSYNPYGAGADALAIGIWTCIAWSLLNLLPILPLDGGQAMRELLPGDPAVRTRRATVVSVVVAGAAAVACLLWLRQEFLALFLLFFAASNVLSLRSTPGPAARRAPAARTPEQSAVELLWQGEPRRARDLLAAQPADTPVSDLAVHGAVMALTGERDQGYALLRQELERRPADADPAALLLLTQALEHDWDAVVATLQGPVGARVPRPVIHRVIEEARGTGREDVAGRLTLITSAPSNPE
jgi:Zn-dependent protease